MSDIERLLDEQKKLRQEKRAVAKDLKNAQKRRRRLKHRARLLSNDDLLTVISLREAEPVAACGKSSAKAKAKAKSSPQKRAGTESAAMEVDNRDRNAEDQ
jgi:hypothetical protein